jgi:murein DD-endopeptidase MepM/ murein hydrolase activator NlpD
MTTAEQQPPGTGPDKEEWPLQGGDATLGSIRRNFPSRRIKSLRRSRPIFFAIAGLVVVTLGGWASSRLAVLPADAGAQAESSSSLADRPLVLTELPAYDVFQSTNSGIARNNELHTVIPDRPRFEILKYTVEAGDSIFAIAERFGLRPETVLWGNYAILQDDPHSLRPGQELNILPVDGTYYEWNEGDGIKAVASFFGVEPEDIVYWPGNGLAPDMDISNPGIAPGTFLIVPGGTREFVSWQAPRISRSNPAVARITGPGACGSVYDGPIGEGYFVWPTTATYLSGTSYSSFHPGIDIAGSNGNAVFASASGVVVYAGWSNYGYGYMVVIDHGDGWQTLYAHMSQVSVGCGQAVFQGGVIGGVGSTGNSTGPHLHFEMQHDAYGKVNPYDLVSP